MIYKRQIEQLPSHVIDQIAAGEVVENPASVIKELIENSLDAQARTIRIEIRDGGLEYLKVEDDGIGMNREDAEACILRHATSKIRSLEDLERLSTMGFRGEALAAIASISKFRLKTAQEKGTELYLEGGKLQSIAPCARNQGTTIEVSSLFYNTPARRKFQKTASFCAAMVRKEVEKIALAHPEVSFFLNEESYLATDWKTRLFSIAGEFIHSIEEEGMWGWIGAPSEAKANRLGQYLYLNQRPIVSWALSKAVKLAYGTRIGATLHPRFALFLTLDPKLFDVNVHPQKKEVRFCDESTLFRKVQRGIEKAFSPIRVSEEPLLFSPPPSSFFLKEEPALFLPSDPSPLKLPLFFKEKAVAVLHRYLLLEKEDWILVDLPGVEARILFEKIQEKRDKPEPLLFPLELPFFPEDEEKLLQLKELGIEYRVIKKTLLIEALPPFLTSSTFPLFFQHLEKKRGWEEKAVRFCRSSTRTYSLAEAERLWLELQKCKDRLYDPLGRLISKVINIKDLDTLCSK